MTKIPDRLYIEKKDRDLYDEITEIFEGKTRKEQFLFSMSIGFKNKIKHPLNTKEGFFLVKDMRPEDEALINAIAISDSDSAEILSNREEVFKIAEEYAHAGIKLFSAEVKSVQFGSFHKQFEKKLFDIYNELNLF